MIKKVKSLKYNSILIETDSQESLCKTFIRFQEHYESPKFKGQIFTIGQIKQWYSETFGANTYYKDWEGFNFPGWVFKPFKDGLFDPLTLEEIELINLFRYRTDNFYVIGSNSNAVTRHELAHALFSFDKNYANTINSLYKTHRKKFTKVRSYLIDKGYHPDVIVDEIQAYVTDNDDEFIMSNLDKKLILSINKIHDKYSDKY